jgi:predicted transcriptional regulator
MKKLFLTLLTVTLLLSWTDAYGQLKIKVGEKVPEWAFPDADKKDFTMNEWEGKVLQINYVDPDESDLNDDYNDYLDKAIDIDKRIDRDHFKGFGIVDCKSTWKPNGLIRMIAGNKAKKYDTTILFDYDGVLQERWGMPRDSYSVVIVDKNRVCRAVYTGKIPESEYEKIVQLIIDITKE